MSDPIDSPEYLPENADPIEAATSVPELLNTLEDDETDVTRLNVFGKEVLLIGTAHISQQSVDVVERIIELEKPDVVMVELDEERYKAITSEQNWQDLDLRQVIKNKQTLFLIARLALGSFQKRMGSHIGVKPGAEMIAAIHAAETINARLILGDRDIRTTLVRAWRLTPFWSRTTVAASLAAGVFQENEISEDELAKLRESQNISEILDELGQALPSVKKVLVDERDIFMAHQIQIAEAKKLVVIIGAAHKPGMLRQLENPIPEKVITEISTVPPRAAWSRILPWALPVLIIAVFIFGFLLADPDKFKSAILAWILANGVLSALGATIALAHPLTIIAAFIAAPITSLNPTIGVGMVTAFVQVMVAPPKVRDMENVGDDISRYSGWWSNRMARVFLVFIFSSIGSSIGTFVAMPWLAKLL